MLEKNPLITIVVPNFNHAQYLGKAIQSALDQTYRNIEIFIVDDGSTDNSRQVVEAFGSSIRYIWQQNQGLSAARNTGIRNSQGELLCFLDADDLLLPNYLETLVPKFDSSKIGVVYCGSQFINPEGKYLPQVQIHSPAPEEYRSYLLEGNLFPVHAAVVRRACFNQSELFDENLKALEDYDLWLRLSKTWFFVGIQEILALTRVRTDSMSADPDLMASQERVMIQKNFPGAEAVSQIDQAEYKKIMGNAELRVATAAINQKQMKIAVIHLSNAFEIYPELSRDLNTYYGLILAELPRGMKVPKELTNLETVTNQLIVLLNETIKKIADDKKVKYSDAFACLMEASGQIAYAQRKSKLARQYTSRAFISSPRIISLPQSLSIILKSYIPIPLFNYLRKIRGYDPI